MRDPDFEEKIAAIMRRLHRMRAAQRGELDTRIVPVKRHFVPGFWVTKHDRRIYVEKPKKVATKRRKAA